MPLLELDRISKSYGAVRILHALSLSVQDGEFLTILGPSGSGKTTILRLVGGFTRPTEGRIRFAGADITAVPTNRRPFNTVFQDYALFPHMTVARNVGYGLMLRRRPTAEITRRVAETLDVVGLGGMTGRYPNELSGGQQQRVALARALICEPRLVLLDEPLAALDAELRRQMRLFLKALQRRIGTTFLFVTHDQEEAITMSDRIVVMNAGRIEQIGSPQDVYYRPQTRFVATFFGDNNLIEGEVGPDGRLATPLGLFPVPAALPAGSAAAAAIRPEKIRIGGEPRPNDIVLRARVEDVVFVGAITQVSLRPEASGDRTLTVTLTSGERGAIVSGSTAEARIAPDDAAVVSAWTG